MDYRLVVFTHWGHTTMSKHLIKVILLHPPVWGPELLPSAGHWREDVCPGVQWCSGGVRVQWDGPQRPFQKCPWWAPQLVEDEGAGPPDLWGICGGLGSAPGGSWRSSSTSGGSRRSRSVPGGSRRIRSAPQRCPTELQRPLGWQSKLQHTALGDGGGAGGRLPPPFKAWRLFQSPVQYSSPQSPL